MEWIYKLSEIDQIAQEIIPHLSSKIILLEGTMGMGKTTFAKAFVKAMGIKDIAGSPTFSLVNEYKNDTVTVYHFDFYRIKNEMEAFDMGVDEYFYSGKWCLIEWSEKISNLIPEKAHILEFQKVDEKTRKILLKQEVG